MNPATTAAIVEAAAPVSQFQGFGGAVIVSLIAFTIVFAVLAGLSAIICFVRYIAMIVEKKDSGVKSVPSAAAPTAVSAPVAAGQDANDMKKVVAAISAAINAATGRSMNIISVVPAQGNCSSMNQMWRVTGIAECMESRLGSRSW